MAVWKCQQTESLSKHQSCLPVQFHQKHLRQLESCKQCPDIPKYSTAKHTGFNAHTCDFGDVRVSFYASRSTTTTTPHLWIIGSKKGINIPKVKNSRYSRETKSQTTILWKVGGYSRYRRINGSWESQRLKLLGGVEELFPDWMGQSN